MEDEGLFSWLNRYTDREKTYSSQAICSFKLLDAINENYIHIVVHDMARVPHTSYADLIQFILENSAYIFSTVYMDIP